MEGAINGHVNVCEILLNKKADPNMADKVSIMVPLFFFYTYNERLGDKKLKIEYKHQVTYLTMTR